MGTKVQTQKDLLKVPTSILQPDKIKNVPPEQADAVDKAGKPLLHDYYREVLEAPEYATSLPFFTSFYAKKKTFSPCQEGRLSRRKTQMPVLNCAMILILKLAIDLNCLNLKI